MTKVRDFVASLTGAVYGRKEIKPLVYAAHADKTLAISQIKQIIKSVKEGKKRSTYKTSPRPNETSPNKTSP
jgi:hypothetical protein